MDGLDPAPRPRARRPTAPSRRELVAFAGVGLLAYAVDLGLFTVLRGPAGFGPLTAKALSFLAGCSVAYTGNAYATYADREAAAEADAGGEAGATLPADRRRHPRLRQFLLFTAVNLAGALVQLLCLAVAHYGLGLTSRRADTVSGAGVGMALATLLRFWGTRTWVFRVHPVTERPPRSGPRTNLGRGGSWTG